MKKGLVPILLVVLLGGGGGIHAQEPDPDIKPAPKVSREAQAKAKARAAKIQAKAKAKAARDAKRVDVNTATRDQLKAIPGLPEAYVDKIITGRPYLTKAHLVTNQVLPEGIYLAIKDRLVVRQAPTKP
ncbi:helix-hairpin-helix domain-containing protein [Geothrix sp. 21YS21S-4]|uniref:helix-hairpin-helix domain-containing protein n=1 Tax=Geothrix sp. 21YS21S-4 TaxID=3068889 RepID=UPI0027BA036B|nr:helix-hairpin-helix domain-containing protein [Geothrix sp. 21YS21S-4]